MSRPLTFADYLLAKRTVDDAALHRGVYAALQVELAAHTGTPLRVLEVGCGIGTMVDRLRDWGLFAGLPVAVDYTAIDSEPTNIEAARTRLAPAPHFELRFVASELYAFARTPAPPFDLVIANAVLDLLDLERALPVLRSLIAPGGLGWFTINFDGATRFLPPLDAPLDAAIERAYHATMDRRVTDGAPSGDSHTGSRLFAALPQHGLPILAAGASDWVVFAHGGRYHAGEAGFLHFILETVIGALRDDPAVKAGDLARWAEARHAQVEAGTLTYLAHQYDFLVRRPAHVSM